MVWVMIVALSLWTRQMISGQQDAFAGEVFRDRVGARVESVGGEFIAQLQRPVPDVLGGAVRRRSRSSRAWFVGRVALSAAARR